jgi:hypothetical protein
MEVDKIDDLRIYQLVSYYSKLMNRAVQEVRDINRQNGLPNDFVINGKMYFELPNGEITTENPLANKTNS